MRHTIHDVEENNVTELFQTGEQCKSSTNLSGTYERDLVTSHVVNFPRSNL